jgi:acyl dehydratase
LNYGLNRVRFTGPVKCGARIRGRFILQSVTDVAGGFQITYAATVEIEGAEKPALVAEWLVRVIE